MLEKTKTITRIICCMLIFFISCVSVTAQDNRFDAALNEPAARYKGNPKTVVKVYYYSKKKKGEFAKTAEGLWTETNQDGVFTMVERPSKLADICLVDSARKRMLLLNFKDRTVYKGKPGSATSSFESDITKLEVSPEGEFAYIEKQATTEIKKEVTTKNTEPFTDNKPGLPANTVQDIPDINKTPVFHAILIAEDKYEETSYNSLPGTIRDLKKLYGLLLAKYTFDPENVDTLINASKERILSKLNAKAKTLNENDNLLIFYAGHGLIKQYSNGNGRKPREEGFLIPSDAAKGDEVTFINSYDITSIMNRCNAKHILFTADACFAGSLFRDIPAEASLRVREAYKEKSRRLLTSGNKQAVSDESDFVESLRIALQENQKKYVTASELIDTFKNQYMLKTRMQLQYNPIPNVDDRGGEFVFFKRK